MENQITISELDKMLKENLKDTKTDIRILKKEIKKLDTEKNIFIKQINSLIYLKTMTKKTIVKDLKKIILNFKFKNYLRQNNSIFLINNNSKLSLKIPAYYNNCNIDLKLFEIGLKYKI